MKPHEELFLNPTLSVELRCRWRRASVGRQERTVLVREARHLSQLLLQAFADSPSTRARSTAVRALRECEILVTGDRLPRRALFRAPIAERIPLLPSMGHQRAVGNDVGASFVINPRCYLPADVMPSSAADARERLEAFARGPLVWCRASGTDVLMPFWPAATLVQSIERARRRPRLHASPALVAVLTAAEVLVSKDDVARRTEAWRRLCQRVAASVKQSGYGIIPRALNPVFLAGLRVYVRRLERGGYLSPVPPPIERASFVHNDPVLRFLHKQLCGLVNRILPEKVMPSYCYLAVYQPGASLPAHTDREQCQWNLSVVLDANPETDVRAAWPFWLQGQSKQRRPLPVRLRIGDGILYSGTRVTHWRETQPAHQRTAVCTFHFVPTSFRGDLN